jgi:diguanylate cyclase (GGDEF)-like protein
MKVEDLLILSEDEKKLIADNIQKRLRGEVFSCNYRLKYKTKNRNEPRWANCFITTVFYNGEWVALGIISDVTELELEMTSYKYISETDKLTGIYNRRAFDNKFTEYFNTSVRYDRPLSLVMFDIDNFKNINDSLGHSVGDTVLQELSSIVQAGLRTTDILVRYGGEEFMIIVPETMLDKTVEFAERLRLKIESFNFNTGKNITCSFGVASRIQDDTLQKMIYRADVALYKAKGSGKNRVESIIDTIYL